MVVTMVLGGMWRRPGPRVRVFFLPVPLGRALWGISSPGRTTVAVVVAMMLLWFGDIGSSSR